MSTLTSLRAQALAIGGAIIASLVAAVAVAAAPVAPDRLAAVFPPWWSRAQLMSAATSAGDIAGVGAAPFILILRSDSPGLEARLRRSGAWLLLNPDAAGVCASPQEIRS